MEPEGMVHALGIVHHLLRPQGLLIDIHPLAVPPPIEAVIGDRRQLIGHLQETDDFIEYTQAEAAIQQSIASGYFTLDKQKEFEFITHAESYAEFAGFIHDEWKDGILEDEISNRWEETSMEWSQDFESSKPEVQMRERVRISRLCRGIIPLAFKETIHASQTSRFKNTPG